MKCKTMKYFIPILLICTLLLSGCSLLEDLPIEVPGNPSLPDLNDLPDLARDLGLPDLSEIPNLPQVSDLPGLSVDEDTLVLAGPTERRIGLGERLFGTDIELVALGDEGAEFRINGLRTIRKVGDSLDFDGGWPGLNGVSYTLRLRLYLLGGDSVRAAGVQRLVVDNVAPQAAPVNLGESTLAIPYSGSAGLDSTLKGLTYGYAGLGDRGAEIIGLDVDEFPFRKIGDSLVWEGLLRPDLPVRYSLRVLFYNESLIQVAGVATVALP